MRDWNTETLIDLAKSYDQIAAHIREYEEPNSNKILSSCDARRLAFSSRKLARRKINDSE